MNEVFSVQGMSCGHCTAAVSAALRQLKGVRSAQVTLEDNTAVVDYDATVVSRDTIIMAIEDEGFSVVR